MLPALKLPSLPPVHRSGDSGRSGAFTERSNRPLQQASRRDTVQDVLATPRSHHSDRRLQPLKKDTEKRVLESNGGMILATSPRRAVHLPPMATYETTAAPRGNLRDDNLRAGGDARGGTGLTHDIGAGAGRSVHGKGRWEGGGGDAVDSVGRSSLDRKATFVMGRWIEQDPRYDLKRAQMPQAYYATVDFLEEKVTKVAASLYRAYHQAFQGATHLTRQQIEWLLHRFKIMPQFGGWDLVFGALADDQNEICFADFLTRFDKARRDPDQLPVHHKPGYEASTVAGGHAIMGKKGVGIVAKRTGDAHFTDATGRMERYQNQYPFHSGVALPDPRHYPDKQPFDAFKADLQALNPNAASPTALMEGTWKRHQEKDRNQRLQEDRLCPFMREPATQREFFESQVDKVGGGFIKFETGRVGTVARNDGWRWKNGTFQPKLEMNAPRALHLF